MRETGFNGLSLSAFDWAAVASYLVATAGLVLWTRLRQRGTSEDYFLAGRSQGWLIVAVTLFASLFSSISFVAVPGEAYRSGLVMSTILIASPLCAPLAVWLFLRFFFLSPSYTAYEYLERRFNVPARVIGAMLFCLTRLIYSGVIYYAAAELFRSLVGWAPPLATIEVACGKGTYIRVLAEDIARALGSCAHLAALRRTAAGPFNIREAANLETLEGLELPERDALLLPVDSPLADLPDLVVDAASARALFHGQLPLAGARADGPCRGYDPEGRFLGLVEVAGDRLRALRLVRASSAPDK